MWRLTSDIKTLFLPTPPLEEILTLKIQIMFIDLIQRGVAPAFHKSIQPLKDQGYLSLSLKS